MQSSRRSSRYNPYRKPSALAAYYKASRARSTRTSFPLRRSYRNDSWDPNWSRYPYSRYYLHKETIQLADVIADTTEVDFAYSFTLSQLQNASQLGNLFDEYRINKIVIEFKSQNLTSVNSASAALPMLYVAFDGTDASTLTIANLMGYSTLRRASVVEGVNLCFTPSVLSSLYDGSALQTQGVRTRAWINSSSTGRTIVHYGIKGAVEAYTQAASNTMSWSVHATFYVTFRNQF